MTMQETGNDTSRQPRMTLRISNHSMAFAMADNMAVKGVAFEPYTAKSGISTAANLREALRSSALLGRECARAQVLIDAPTLLVPIEEYDDATADAFYRYTLVTPATSVVMSSVVPTLNSLALFGVNRDLRQVIDDRYADVRYMPVEQPVWSYLHRRSFSDTCHRLYAYFHDERVSVFAFDKNRFRYCNAFEVSHVNDCVYFILYVWRQLQLDADRDELYLSGNMPERDSLVGLLRRYLRKCYSVNPAAEFNRAPITEIKGMALDMVTLFLKGR